MFSRFGRVLRVSAKKNVVMRGQAFIAFQNPLQAQEALKTLNNAPFFGKLMEIQWAKRDSDITLSPAQAQKNKETRKRLISKNYFQTPKFKERMNKKIALRSKEMQNLNNLNMNLLDKMLNPDNTNPDHQNPSDLAQNKIPKSYKEPKTSMQKPLNEPHSMLILEKLPDIATDDVKKLFSSFEGFKEIRHIRLKRLALVDFMDSSAATTALESVKSHMFESGDLIQVNFAKK